MKAMVWTAYGPPDVLQLKEVEKPAPDQDEEMVRIYASTVTAGDCEQLNLKLPFHARVHRFQKTRADNDPWHGFRR